MNSLAWLEYITESISQDEMWGLFVKKQEQHVQGPGNTKRPGVEEECISMASFLCA